MILKLRCFLPFCIIALASCKLQHHSSFSKVKLYVTDSVKTGLPFAKIRFMNGDTTINGLTDIRGKKIIELKKGSYNLQIEFPGFYLIKDYPIEINKRKLKVFVECTGPSFKKVNVKWSGGWATVRDKHGNLHFVRIPEDSK